MDRLIPQSIDDFNRLLDYNRKEKAWTGLILTGSEITLLKGLPELAKQAKTAGFEHVRIQTHGMHLDNPRFCESLIEAGVDEYFVSMPGSNPDTHDAITEVKGSFRRTLKAMQNLDQYDHVTTITNTVVTNLSYRLLPDIVHALSHLKQLKQMEFWVYWPMNETDEKQLAANHLDLLPYLKSAVRLAREYGRSIEIKNFPHCLLGEDAEYLVNDQPQLFIDPDFWKEFERNGFYQCKYMNECTSRQCLGLNTAYINRYGWHEDDLHPI